MSDGSVDALSYALILLGSWPETMQNREGAQSGELPAKLTVSMLSKKRTHENAKWRSENPIGEIATPHRITQI